MPKETTFEILVRANWPHLSPLDVLQGYAKKGYTIVETGEHLGVSHESIKCFIKKCPEAKGLFPKAATRRRGDVIQYKVNGEYLNRKEISQKYGIPYNTLKHRIALGWPIEDAIREGDHRYTENRRRGWNVD